VNDISFDLCLPDVRLGRIDLVRAALRIDVEHELAGFLRGPVHANGHVRTYPLRVPDGQAAALPTRIGYFEFRNDRGVAVFSLPVPFMPLLLASISEDAVVRPAMAGTTPDGYVVSTVGLRSVPGTSWCVPLGQLGDIRVTVVRDDHGDD